MVDYVIDCDYLIFGLSGMAEMDARLSLERLDVDNYAKKKKKKKKKINFPAENLERGGARAAEALSQEPLTAAQPPPPRFWLNRQRLFPALAVGFLCRANF